MDVNVIIEGGAEIKAAHPEKYDKVQEKILKLICGFPEVSGGSIDNEPRHKGEPGTPPWNGQIRIIFENGEHLADADMDAYYDLRGKIRDLVKEAFPQVTVCDVEAWSEGFYGGSQLREAVAAALKEREVIGRFASAIRKTRENEVLPDGMAVLKIKVPQAWVDLIDEYYAITGKDRDEDMMDNIEANIEGFMLGERCGLSKRDRDRLAKKYDLDQEPS